MVPSGFNMERIEHIPLFLILNWFQLRQYIRMVEHCLPFCSAREMCAARMYPIRGYTKPSGDTYSNVYIASAIQRLPKQHNIVSFR